MNHTQLEVRLARRPKGAKCFGYQLRNVGAMGDVLYIQGLNKANELMLSHWLVAHIDDLRTLLQAAEALVAGEDSLTRRIWDKEHPEP